MSQGWWRYAIILISILSWMLYPNLTRSQVKPIKSKPEFTNQKFVYTPIALPLSGEVRDILSDRDIPNGDGGFARDYSVEFNAGDQIAIDLISDSFDTIVILLSADGKTIGKNDDGPDGSSNSLLFMRLKYTGKYIIRVQGFGETSSGEFTLKVTKLKPK